MYRATTAAQCCNTEVSANDCDDMIGDDMRDFKNFFIRKHIKTLVGETASTEVEPPVRTNNYSSGIHYLATQRGFLKGFTIRHKDNGQQSYLKPDFTSNARYAKQFDSFAAADYQGKQLMIMREGVRYYAIVKPA
jgi:hypothetical protein